jgi:SAM-dependent methyltransferase
MTSTYTKYIERYEALHLGEADFLDTKGQKHRSKALFDGKNFEEKLWKHLKPLLPRYETIRFLDYGCGKARHFFEPLIEKRTLPQLLGRKLQSFYLYDPAYPPYSLHPDSGSTFNIVSCSDVMEHVPEKCVDEVLEDISWLSTPDAVVFFSIAGSPAYKSFADGENLHCTLKPMDWWIQQILDAAIGKFVLVYTDKDGEHTFKRGVPDATV